MKPVVLVTGDFVPTGGMDRANYALASYLARQGHPLTLVAHRTAIELQALNGVTIRHVRKPLGSYLLGSWWLDAVGRRAAHATDARVLVNGGNCQVLDVNWVHYVHEAYTPVIRGSLARRLKIAFEIPRNRRLEGKAIRGARVVIANSERTKRDLIQRLGVAAERIHVVYYGIDADRFRPVRSEEKNRLRQLLKWPISRPVILFIGALSDRRKGFDTLFDAWRILSKKPEWNAILAVIGEGAERRLWKERVKSMRLGGSVQFLGFRSDVPDVLRAADALVAPTRYEAYGLGVHEAICCGLPAIVSSDAGVAERYPSELQDLLLPNADDVADLVAKLERWRSNREGHAARVAPLGEKFRTWSWDQMSKRIWEIIA